MFKKLLSIMIIIALAISIFPSTSALGLEDYHYVSKIDDEVWEFGLIQDIDVDSQGNLYVVDWWDNEIVKFSKDGEYITNWGGYGSEDGQFDRPNSLAVSGNYVYVGDLFNDRIQKFDLDGNFISKWGVDWLDNLNNNSIGFGGNGDFNALSSVAADRSGNVYVLDTGYVQKFNSNGGFVTQFRPHPLLDGSSDEAISVDSDGNLYLTNSLYENVEKRNSNTGQLISSWGSSGSGYSEFGSIGEIANDSSGNIFITDRSNSRIQKFSSNSSLLSVWGSNGFGNGQFTTPSSIAIDSLGNVYVGEGFRIQKFAPGAAPALSPTPTNPNPTPQPALAPVQPPNDPAPNPVEKIKTKLTLVAKPGKVEYGKLFVVNGRLTTLSGKPVVGQEIVIKVWTIKKKKKWVINKRRVKRGNKTKILKRKVLETKEYWGWKTLSSPVKTNDEGYYKLRIRPKKAKHKTYRAYFRPNDTYKDATSEKLNVKIQLKKKK